MANGPLTVRAQLDAVVSSVPVKPVMSMLAIVVAAARVVVPVGVALKITSFVATGVQLHVAPPDVFDQFAPVAQRIPKTAKASSPADAGETEMLGFAVVPLAVVPPAVGVVAQTPPKRTVAHTCFPVPLVAVPGIRLRLADPYVTLVYAVGPRLLSITSKALSPAAAD